MDATLALPGIDAARCTGCADCVEACHAHALAIRGRIAVMARAAACDYCTDCEAICPAGAVACPFEVVVRAPEPHDPTERDPDVLLTEGESWQSQTES